MPWAALFLFGVFNLSSAVEVTFLFWGDRHSRNLPSHEVIDGAVVEVGGAGALSGMVNALRDDDPRTLVFVTGGEFGGAPISVLTKGVSQVKLLNSIGIDAMIPGEHEYDYGWRSLQEVMAKANFPVLLANVINDETSEPLFVPDTMFILPGVKIGVIGLIDPDFKSAVIRSGVLGIEGYEPAGYVREFVSRRREDCDILVALTCLDWEMDSLLAVESEGLDIIIGRSDRIPSDSPRLVNNVIIARSGADGKWLGRLSIEVDTGGGGIVSHHAAMLHVEPGEVPVDKKVDRLARRLEKKHTKVLNHRIGTLHTDWNLEYDKPSNLAQWAADVMREVSPSAGLAVINHGNFMKGIPAGPILEKDIWEICPYDYPIVVFQISGNELIRILRRQIVASGEFITWSGLILRAEDGELVDARIKGKLLNWRDDYAVVATGYFWDNLEDLLRLSKVDRPHFYLPEANQREIFIKAIESKRIISTPLDDRWIVR